MNKNDARDALTTLRLAHTSIGGTATTISDFLEDPAAFSSPTVIDAMTKLINSLDEPDNCDITAILELITPFEPDLAEEIANREELCPSCFSDIEICDC
jgi:hypothetical protein